MSRFSIIPVLLFCTLSCSIKEDRAACPVEFELCVSAPDDIVGRKIALEVSDDKTATSEQKDEFAYQGGWHTRSYRLPAKELRAIACYGASCSEARYTIREGMQCDSLYSACTRFRPSGETGRDSIVLRKNFATVFFDLRFPSGQGDNPYTIYAKADTGGYSMAEDVGIRGKYSYKPYYTHNAQTYSYVFRLPRLLDESFSIQFCDRESGASVYTEVFSNDKLEMAGYSWQKDYLDDIHIVMSIGDGQAGIEINGWDYTSQIEVTI